MMQRRAFAPRRNAGTRQQLGFYRFNGPVRHYRELTLIEINRKKLP